MNKIEEFLKGLQLNYLRKGKQIGEITRTSYMWKVGKK